MEGALLLQLVPLLLEHVQGLGHVELLQEVANEVVDHHISFQGFRHGLLDASFAAFVGFIGLLLLLLSPGLEDVEVVEVVVFLVHGLLDGQLMD